MKKLFLTMLCVLLYSIGNAQFGFVYHPYDSSWNNVGGWSNKLLYVQKDSTGLKNSFFFKFYSPLVQFNRHTVARNDGTPTSILWANDTGALQRSPIVSIQLPYTSITSAPWLTSYTETDPTVPSYVKAITSTNISNWNTVVGYGNPATQYVSLTGSYSNPSWLTSLAQSKISYTGTTSQYIKGDGSIATFPTLTSGTVTSVGISSVDLTIGGTNPVTSSGIISLTLPAINSNVGTYNNLTVNSKGQVTAGSNTSYLTGNQSIALTGDVTGSGSTSISTTLANSGVTAGSYAGSYTVDAKGRITAANAKIQTAVTPSLNTAFQVSSSLSSDVNYSINVQITSALAGTNTGTVQLQISSTSGGTYTTINQSGMSLSGIVSTVGATQNLSGFVPVGYWVKIVTAATGTNSGSAVFTAQASQQVTY